MVIKTKHYLCYRHIVGFNMNVMGLQTTDLGCLTQNWLILIMVGKLRNALRYCIVKNI